MGGAARICGSFWPMTKTKVILLMRKLIDWEALGYEIAGTANDGLRALELVREKQPHLLITDVRMPAATASN